jgi:hypothetical protein
MTDKPSDTTADEPTADAPANSNFAVLTAIAELGLGATPAAIAERVGIAYSTVNPKLRAWESAGLAERFRHDTGQTLWRLTDAGRTSTATPPQFAAEPSPEPGADMAATPTAPSPGTEDTSSLPPPPTGGDKLNRDDEDEPQEPVLPAKAPVSGTAVDELTSDDSSIETVDSSPDGAGQADSGCPDSVSDTAASPPEMSTAPDIVSSTGQPAGSVPDDRVAEAATTSATAAAPAKRKRPSGAVTAGALAIMQANPGHEYTIDQLKKLIDQADAGTGYPRVSHGAVANAVTKLAGKDGIEQVDDRRAATFRMVPATD